jgi:hypothetical protein
MLLSNYLQHHEDVIAQQSGDKVALFDMESDNYHSFNELGARIWKLCGGRLPLAEVVDLLEAECDAPREHIQDDCRALIEELLEKQFARRQERRLWDRCLTPYSR